jgi:hypothetical protein
MLNRQDPDTLNHHNRKRLDFLCVMQVKYLNHALNLVDVASFRQDPNPGKNLAGPQEVIYCLLKTAPDDFFIPTVFANVSDDPAFYISDTVAIPTVFANVSDDLAFLSQSLFSSACQQNKRVSIQ